MNSTFFIFRLKQFREKRILVSDLSDIVMQINDWLIDWSIDRSIDWHLKTASLSNI